MSRVTLRLVMLAALLVAMVAATVAPRASATSTLPLLPGETLWNGIPSYLFGANDAFNWAGTNGFDQQSTEQAAVRAGHVPLIRGWFPATNGSFTATDAYQLHIADTITGTGAACLANLTQPNTIAYDLHLVSLLKGKCELYEVMNEPDLVGVWPPAVSATNYIAFWKSFVPQARAIDPNAKFGGPATASPTGNAPDPATGLPYLQAILQGMAASGVAPDFVTFHNYSCFNETAAQCLVLASQLGQHGVKASGWIAQYFPGKAIPLGLTEWNVNPGNPGYMYDDAYMSQYMSAALASLEASPYVSFATQYDLGSFACNGACDLFRAFTNTAYTNTPAVVGAPRPEFTTLVNEIARVRSGSPPTPTPPPPTPSPTGTPPPPTPTTPPPPTPTPAPSGIPRYDHVVTIMEENHEYSQIVGSPDAPYINNTLLPNGGLATNFFVEVASSLPNYMALTGGTTLGWTANCEPLPTPPNGVGPCPGGLSQGPSIASEALAAGKTWKAYEENMSANCQNATDGGLNGLYTIHHNPFPYYATLTSCATNDVPLAPALANDLGSPATFPNYVFITPNLVNDMHNGTVAQGDTWLSQEIPAIQNSPACKQSTCLIAVTFDESYEPSNEHVMTLLVGPGVLAGAKDGTAYNDYNLLKTEELALGLPAMTSHDGNAAGMKALFGSSGPTPTPTPIPPTPTPSPTPVPCTQAITNVHATVSPASVAPGGVATVTLHYTAACAGPLTMDGYWIFQSGGGVVHHSVRLLTAVVGANEKVFTWTALSTQTPGTYHLLVVFSRSDRAVTYATRYPVVALLVT